MNSNHFEISRDSVVTRREDVVYTELEDGEIMMMSVKNGEYYGLDPIASEIWVMLAEPLAVSEICDRLLSRYEVSTEDCERDVVGFLQEMVSPLEIVQVAS